MKSFVKNCIIILFCLSITSLILLSVIMCKMIKYESYSESNNSVEEKIDEKIEWTVTYNVREMSKQMVSDEFLEEQFYLDNIPKEYGDAFLYYSRNRKEMRPYFYALMMHESNGFTAFVNKNKDGSYDYGPSQLNSNNIKNKEFRKWYNPKDESHITSRYCFYMVMTMNFYWDLVNKYGYDYAFYAYNGGERTIKMIKNGSSHKNASLIKTVKTYDAKVRTRMVEANIKRNEYINEKRIEHIDQLITVINDLTPIDSTTESIKDNKLAIQVKQDLLDKRNQIRNNNIFYIRRDELLQFEIKEGAVVGETIIGTFNI